MGDISTAIVNMGESEMRQRKSANMSEKQMDQMFSNYVEGKQEEVTKKEQNKKMINELQDKGPTYVFVALCVAVVLLTIGGSFHDEPTEDRSHYTTLGIKRMSKADEVKVAYDKLSKELSGDAL